MKNMKPQALSFLLLLILVTVFYFFGGITPKVHFAKTFHSPSSTAAWSSIEVSQEAGDALLRWKARSTAGVDCFVVERSSDGKNFESLGHIRANGADHQDFTFRDPALLHPSGNKVYYRLRQIGQDGRSLTSQIRKLPLPKRQQVQIKALGKPETGQLTLRYVTGASASAQLNVVDAAGHVVLHQTLPSAQNEQELNIEVNDWASGAYVIQLFNANSRTQYRFVIA